jgi:hypothetical protein
MKREAGSIPCLIAIVLALSTILLWAEIIPSLTR